MRRFKFWNLNERQQSWIEERKKIDRQRKKKVTFGNIHQRDSEKGGKRSLISPYWILLPLAALLMKYGCGTIFKVNTGRAAAGTGQTSGQEKPHGISSVPLEELHRQFVQWGGSFYVSTPTACCCRATGNCALHRNGPHFFPHFLVMTRPQRASVDLKLNPFLPAKGVNLLIKCTSPVGKQWIKV